jgi:hypothetical protein
MPEIYTQWKTDFDVALLRQHLEQHVLPLEPVQQAAGFGGWSVLSSNGDYRDGWAQGHRVIEAGMNALELKLEVQSVGMKPLDQYVRPTQICHSYMADVIEFFRSKSLNPRRARIIRLSHGQSSSWHRDAPDNVPLIRLHVPIVTNSGCFFATEHGRAHLPADGSSYFLRVNRMHCVTNEGKSDRFHVVIDVDCEEALKF